MSELPEIWKEYLYRGKDKLGIYVEDTQSLPRFSCYCGPGEGSSS